MVDTVPLDFNIVSDSFPVLLASPALWHESEQRISGSNQDILGLRGFGQSLEDGNLKTF